jgi:DNA segregation ATPase FtsK/SpoIIIE-like protein
MLPIALVIDEVAEVDDQEALVRHVKVNRAAGLFPIFATNDPTKSSVIAKSNLQTRISMPVVSAADSVTGLGRTGAQNLPKKQGRGLIQVEGRLVEFQSFRVDYPMPTADGLKWLETHVADTEEPKPTMAESLPAATQPVDAVAQMAESIRGRWTPEMRQADVARLLGFPQTGGAYGAKTKAVMAYLTTTTTTTTQNSPENGVFKAIPAQ